MNMTKLRSHLAAAAGALLFTAAMAKVYDTERRIVEPAPGIATQTRAALTAAAPCYCEDTCHVLQP